MKKNILLIATHNKAKFEELSTVLQSLIPSLKLISLSDLDITSEPVETGKTFEENARLKAQYYSKLSGFPTLSDDGGIVIDALNGEPGVKSNRWLDRKASGEELVQYCLSRMKRVPEEKRTSRFEVWLCVHDPKSKKELIEHESIEGFISDIPRLPVPSGYPYRALFKIKELNKYYSELTSEEHQKINHRLKAVNRLSEKLKTWYN